jgi:chaperonin GroEL (HSP60 family)
LIIPKILAESCNKEFLFYDKNFALNIENEKIENMFEAGIVETLNTKISILNLSLELSNLIIKIDQNIYCGHN